MSADNGTWRIMTYMTTSAGSKAPSMTSISSVNCEHCSHEITIKVPVQHAAPLIFRYATAPGLQLPVHSLNSKDVPAPPAIPKL
jgi:DNA-directed RNA polymerase subunit RPC12/RpoP